MTDLLSFINEQYPCGPFSIEGDLETSGQRKAYRLQAPGGRFVAKLTYPGRSEDVVRADVGTPLYLCAQGFPAPRPIAARDGRLYLPFEDRFVYLYEYIEGAYPVLHEDFYTRLGTLLARLHSFPVTGEVPLSGYTPQSVLTSTRAALQKVNGFVGYPGDLSPEQQQAIVPELIEMIDRFPSFAELPQGMIHTDPYFVNLIETPHGELYLIDWEDGGISYPLMDVGYVLAFLCNFSERDRENWNVPAKAEGLLTRPDWGSAFMAAYEAVRPLTEAERRLLPDAIHVNLLAYFVDWETGALILDHYWRMKATHLFLTTGNH